MPKVSEKKKNKGGQPYICEGCSDKIVPGESYYQWSFRFGGTHRQHTKHGSPKQSQLTQSKMSGVYAAVESAERQIAGTDNADDIGALLEECATEVEQVKDEYQESLDNMGDGLS